MNHEFPSQTPIRYGSVCSGIEAASVAWCPLGWQAAWFSEIEPFPCKVLAHHYPTVPNHGDMTTLARRILAGEVEAPKVLVGGTPCQAFSTAGLRESLDDARGQLTLSYIQILNAIDSKRPNTDPAIAVWENVPGVLSTKDNAFGHFLAGLVGESGPLLPPDGRKWPNAGVVCGPQRTAVWRILDAQHLGVPQRRRRVFLVAGAGADPERLASVLFERESLPGDPPAGGETGQKAPGPAGEGTTGRLPEPSAVAYSLAGATSNALKSADPRSGFRLTEVAQTVDTAVSNPACNNGGTVVAQPIGFYSKGSGLDAVADLSPTVRSISHDQGGQPPAVAQPVLTRESGQGYFLESEQAGALRVRPGGAYSDNLVAQPVTQYGPLAGSLTARHDSSPCADRGQNLVAQPVYSMTDGGGSGGLGVGVAPTMKNHAGSGRLVVAHPVECFGGNNTSGPVSVATACRCQGGSWHGDFESETFAVHNTGVKYIVRRLLPVECERLQDFPQNYTRIPIKPVKSKAPSNPDDYYDVIDGKLWVHSNDGARYKALGNSMATCCMLWIGRRLNAYLLSR